MQRNWLLPAGLIGVLAIVGWCVWTGAGGSPDPEDHVPATPGARGPGQSVLDGSSPPPEVRRESSPVPAETGMRTEALERSPLEAAEPEGDPVELVFVDPGGEAVRELEVVVVGGDTIEDDEGFWELETVDTWMDEHATSRHTVETGRLRILIPADADALLVARADELWARQEIWWVESGVFEVVLERDVTLRAEVRDLDGEPVPGARVQLLATRGSDSWASLTRPVSAETRVAEFPHAQEWIRFEGEPGTSWSLAVEGIFARRVAFELDEEALPEDLVILTAPACGSVHIHVLDELGRPFAGPA